jgi:alkanesulfonate monooxygenase SsuD/methylene tetrahydromethanopterin reductase-like flavin-dependent oxidoreductase (luciferase family)
MHLSARARLAAAPGTPVMVSALQEGSFELAGELSDGAITWLCPPDYVRTRGTPALERGAERAGRERPPIVLHVLVCQDTDSVRVAESASTSFGAYTQFEFYRDMFAAAGHPPSSEPRFSPKLAESLVVHGTDDEIRERLEGLSHQFEHLMVSPVATADGRNADVINATRSAIQLLAEIRS